MSTKKNILFIQKIHERFKQEKIEIPFPVRTILQPQEK